MQKIITNLWFDHEAEEAVHFYTSLFEDGEIIQIDHYGKSGAEVAGMPEGSVLTVDFTINGQIFVAINGGPVFHFTPAISLMVMCKDQDEVDRLWEALSEGGEKSQCGWLTDRYGLSWQIVPEEMIELLHDPDPVKAERLTSAMLKMDKLDVNELRRVAQQDP